MSDSQSQLILPKAHNISSYINSECLLVQIVSLEGVCESWGLWGGGGVGGGGEAGGAGGGAAVRALSFSVFSAARRLLQHRADGKSLTGFGTAADANLFLNSKDVSITLHYIT